MTARLPVRALVAGVLAAGAFLACTLDWDVRPDPTTALVPGADGAVDGHLAEPRMDAGDASLPFSDADASEGSNCAALRADVAEKLSLARVCTFQSGECLNTVKNECGCDVVVTKPAAPATVDYSATVDALKAQCKSPCVACPATTGRSCLVKQPGNRTECYPP